MHYVHHSLGSYLSMLFLVLQFTFHLLGFTRCSLVFDEANQEARKNKYCSRVGDCLPGTHVMCMYGDKKIMGPRCSGGKMLPFTEDEKAFMLDILNEFKRSLALGQESLPKAYGMRKLFWHESLAEFAQAWANQCDGGRHDLCRSSEEFPRAGQAMFTLRFNYPDWSLQDVQFKDKSNNLTPEKRKQVIESFAEGIYETSTVNKQQIEDYPSGDFRNSYLVAVHGTTTNVGCGMSTFHDYYRTTDDEPIIFHAVEIVCNFSSQPKEGEKVYETKWSDGEGWTTCGCPDGFVEDDCLCVPGNHSDSKDDKENEEKDAHQNKDKDDQQNKDKNEQNTDKGNQQNEDKNEHLNNDKEDERNKDKDHQQKKHEDDPNNDTDEDDRDNQTNKDILKHKIKKISNNKTENHDNNVHGTCAPGDSSCTPKVVIMPIITVENADLNRFNEAQKKALAKDLEQRKQQLRLKIKDRIKNVRDRYFKDYVVLEPGTRFSNGGPIDEDTFVLSKNHTNYTPYINRKELNNFGTNTKRTNIEIKDRRDFSDLDQLVSEYLLNLHDDKAVHSTVDMGNRSVKGTRENNINGKQANTKKYPNPITSNLQNNVQGFRKAISNLDNDLQFPLSDLYDLKAKEYIKGKFNNIPTPNKKMLDSETEKIDLTDYAIEDHLNTNYEPRVIENQRNTLPEREQNPLNINEDDTNHYDYQLYSENNQGDEPQYVVEDYAGLQNDEKSSYEYGRGQNRQLVYDANEVTRYYLDKLNEDTNAGHRLDTGTNTGPQLDTETVTGHRLNTGDDTGQQLDTGHDTGQRLDPETLTGYRLDTGIDTRHRQEHRWPIHLAKKPSKSQHHLKDGREMEDHKQRYFVPDRVNLEHG
ncbi:putative uncharacterized protein DDB_G0282133 isoform X2 [Cydia pomonella]|uniref:putative uncharacterized protein DDB_G0282133 isoform X2 n=1 Tax=Cydia pomonella TaxID=82600 RepID=UPI002ADDF2D5|nr:putative uncharacterized protein DDB_G0282133 isoform X2 [Cydia pomonella]